MACKCISKLNKELIKHDAQVSVKISLDFETRKASVLGPFIAVERISKSRKRIPPVLCTYCPVCGKKI